MTASRIAARVEASLDLALARLARYVQVPAVSSDPAHAADVARLADLICSDLAKAGFGRARVLALEGAHPCVAAEWTAAGPDKPTVLIYGHFDIQPVKGETWATPPHELVRKGNRVYARGSADDMGGWLSHLVSLEAWLAETGGLPCNVKLLIEGEEEIGSPNLERYMDAHPDAFAADVMVLTDCENPSTEIPGLTVSLRGLLELDVSVETADCDVHSGLWGNLVPDPSMLLVKLLARLVDEDGRLAFGRREIDAAWMESSRAVPLDAAVVRSGAHLLEGVSPLPDRALTPAAWAWRQPAITVLSTTFPAPGTEKNAIRKAVSARISCRIAPGQTKEELLALVSGELTRDVPGGARVRVVDLGGGATSWDYTPKGPAFEAADRAYTKAWGQKLTRMGIGGSIPFVALFGRRYGNLPLILNGVIDPDTTAHGPNESMDVGVFRKTMAANVYLLDELSRLPRH
jgi:acetylornithine deacetylase/succinyl-diaminopimelate desuccinylase-like protein